MHWDRRFSLMLISGLAVRADMKREGKAAAASNGIVIGRVQKLLHGRQPIPVLEIAIHDIEQEVMRLSCAIAAAKAEIDLEYEHLNQAGIEDSLLLLDVQRMLIVDPELLNKASARIAHEGINAEWALRQEMDAIQYMFEQVEDEYLRNRQHDIEHAGRKIIAHLMQSRDVTAASTSSLEMDRAVIYVGDDFSVADVVRMWRQGVAGVITEQGGADAHNIIVARGIGLPMLVGATDILASVEDGELLILDGEQTTWLRNPSAIEQAAYEKFIAAVALTKKRLEAYVCKPSLSADGYELKLMANIEFPEELDMADHIGIDGIGLYRSEFLFINESSMLDEDTQFAHYATLVKRMQGKPVTMRLLDVGGDRPWLYKDLAGHAYAGANPALGLRGLRLLLRNQGRLKIQLRAMLRAADVGAVRILVPMVTNHTEMEQLRDIAEQCRNELGISHDVPLGCMIEVPAAALMATELAKVSDFFSIGTNDLMQYTLAADRNDEEVSALHKHGRAAVLQLIELTAKAAKKAGIGVSVCGELAANPEWTSTFLNLDMEYLSMGLNSILPIRHFLSRQHYSSSMRSSPDYS